MADRTLLHRAVRLPALVRCPATMSCIVVRWKPTARVHRGINRVAWRAGLRCRCGRFGDGSRIDGGSMGTITTTDGTEIFYKDWGSGQPIVFSHGWPLSADDWDTQLLFFLQHGYRVVAHDRRGHGRSTQTSDGHD